MSAQDMDKFQEDLMDVVNRYREARLVTLSDVVGVLHIISANIIRQAQDDDLDDEDDEPEFGT